jgi:hypothetical protein
MNEYEASRSITAARFSIHVDDVPTDIADLLQADPLLVHHLGITHEDPDLRSLVLEALHSKPSDPELSTARLLRNGFASAFNWVRSGLRLVGGDVRDRRIETCLACPHARREVMSGVYRVIARAREDVVCGMCGCPVHSKARLNSEECPDGRWARR